MSTSSRAMYAFFFAMSPFVGLGCRSTTARCHDVYLQDLDNRLYERREGDYWDRVTSDPRYAAATDSGKLRIQRSIRAKMAVELRRRLDSTNRASGIDPDELRRMTRDTITPAKDSADPKSEPPPRPSDLQWYNEHCYQGHPR